MATQKNNPHGIHNGMTLYVSEQLDLGLLRATVVNVGKKYFEVACPIYNLKERKFDLVTLQRVVPNKVTHTMVFKNESDYFKAVEAISLRKRICNRLSAMPRGYFADYEDLKKIESILQGKTT